MPVLVDPPGVEATEQREGARCALPDLYSAVLRAATEHAIIGTDIEGTITVFNDGAARLLGYTAAEVVGRATPLLFHDPVEVAARAAELGLPPGFGVFIANARHDLPETREWSYLRHDGARVPVTLTVTAMHAPDGRLAGYLGLARDITERRRLIEREHAARAAAERAAERMARLQQLTEALSGALSPTGVASILLDQGIAALDASAGFVGFLTADGHHLDVMPSAGYPAHRFPLATGRPAAVAVQRRQPIFLESRAALAAAYPHLVAGAEAAEGTGPHHAWAAVPLLVDDHAVGAIGLSFATPRRFDDGDRAFIVAIARQCAQALERARLVEAERRARAESEHLKDEFLANVSHDLRTPVAAIKAAVGVVLANEPPDMPPPLHRLLVNIDDATDRMDHLVDDVLELTRLQAGRIQLKPERYDLRNLVARAAAAIEPLAQTRGQRVTIALPRRPVKLMVDEQRLQRALLNLLANAHKYGQSGGTIRVTLATHDADVVISVSDDGPGIAREEHDRIFQRFYRAASPPAPPPVRGTAAGSASGRGVRSTAPDTPPPGSGLGLAIARAMVQLHRGRIWVESEAGQGATFHIALPRHASGNDAPPAGMAHLGGKAPPAVAGRPGALGVPESPAISDALARSLTARRAASGTVR